MTGQEQRDQQPWTAPTAPAIPAPTTPMAPPTQPLTYPDVPQPTVSLAAPAPGELLRFGPGVPATILDLGQAAAVWRGENQPVAGGGNDDARRRRRRLINWLLPLLVLIAVLAILLWQHSGSPLVVTDASVQAASPSLTCDGTATVTATMHTNGADGTITYRWHRSDGTVSDVLRQQTTKGSTDIHVVLLWSFHGRGAVHATATLEVLSPSGLSESASFVYSCS
jgi:hypothetical protein